MVVQEQIAHKQKLHGGSITVGACVFLDNFLNCRTSNISQKAPLSYNPKWLSGLLVTTLHPFEFVYVAIKMLLSFNQTRKEKPRSHIRSTFLT